MLARLLAVVLAVGASSLCFGGCIYPDLDSYAGPCRFKGRDDSPCGDCIRRTCPAAADALCDGTSDAEYDLKELDSCAPVGKCSLYGFDGAFGDCLKECPACTVNN